MENKKHRPIFDYLRLICCLEIIFVHVIKDRFDVKGASLQGIARISLPMFFLLSGALILASGREIKLGEFYLKRVEKILIPFMIYSLYYSCWLNQGHRILEVPTKDSLIFGFRYIPNGIKELLQNQVYFHFWFMYALIGIYIFIPFFQKGLKALNQTYLRALVIVILIMSSFEVYLPLIGIQFGFTNLVFGWVMYPIVGYALLQIKNRKYWWWIMSAGIASLILTIIWRVNAGSTEALCTNFYDLAPHMLIQTCGMFTFFMLIEEPLTHFVWINRIVTWVSRYTFSVYMIHGFILIYYMGTHPGCDSSLRACVKTTIIISLLSFVFSVLVDSILVNNVQRLFRLLIQGIAKLVNKKREQAISE